MFVIMGSTGEYSDRSVFTIGYTADEERAKELVIEYVAKDRLEVSISKAKRKMKHEFEKNWEIENPMPINHTRELPKFDQARQKDRPYVEERRQLRFAYDQSIRQYTQNVLHPWYIKKDEMSEVYVEQNFTVAMCELVEWTDSQFWYKPIKELF